MERIKTFVQKIQEIYYSKHPKSAIDIDLMLDYTRVMYIDLLEWRKEFAAPVHSDITTLLQEHSDVATANETAPSQPAAQQTAEEAVSVDESKDASPAPEKEATPVAQAPSDTAVTAAPEADVKATLDEEEPELVQEFPEEESLATLAQEQTGISYEAPVVAERPVEIKNTLVEETPVETHTLIETPAPAPVEIPIPEKKAFEPARLFDHIVETKDIRTSIGINDKYLFLNELFNNHKSNYEEALDKLNQIKTKEEAMDWVKTKVAQPAHWDDNDGTVQSFYALLEKHFSAR